jgi:dTDP-4-dehydrorhamnose reductase
MKILIIGSTGLVGSAIKGECEKRNIEILCPTHKELDITIEKNIRKYIKLNNPSIIINSAAIAGKKQSLADKKKTYMINVKAVKYLTDICTEEDILLVHMSSSSVFDGKRHTYYENSPLNPTTYYGRTKYLAELYIENNSSKYYIIRLPLIFGSRNNSSVGVLDKFMRDMLDGKKLKIATDKVQTCGYSCDVSKGIMDIIKVGRDYGIYHLGNKGSVNFYKFISTINKYLGCPAKIQKGKCKDFGEEKGRICLNSMHNKNNLRHWKKAMYEYINITYKKDW